MPRKGVASVERAAGVQRATRVAMLAAAVALSVLACFAAPLAYPQAAIQPAAQFTAPNSASAGDAQRGKLLFTQTYRCYACHGYTAQTGAKRLVPMNFPQEAFIGLVQNSTLPQMPKFADVPADKLADIYAYLKSIPPDTRPLADVPLLQDISARRAKAR